MNEKETDQSAKCAWLKTIEKNRWLMTIYSFS